MTAEIDERRKGVERLWPSYHRVDWAGRGAKGAG